MKLKIIVIIILALLFCPLACRAEEVKLDLSGLEKSSKQYAGIGFGDIYSAITGEGSVWQLIIQEVRQSLICEPLYGLSAVKTLLITAIVGGIASVMARELGEASEVVNYICRLSLIASAIVSLNDTLEIMIQGLNDIISLINSCLPLLGSLLIIGGRAAQAATAGSFLAMTCDIAAELTNTYLSPLIMLCTLASMVNCLTEKRLISKLSELMNISVGFIIKCGSLVFIYLISMERITGGIMNKAVSDTARAAVGAVPVVGSTLKNGAEVVGSATSALSGGIGIAVCVVLVLMCVVPLFRIGIIIFLFKVSAAAVEPICDRETAEIIDSAANGCILAFAALFSVMFIFATGFLIMLTGL